VPAPDSAGSVAVAEPRRPFSLAVSNCVCVAEALSVSKAFGFSALTQGNKQITEGGG